MKEPTINVLSGWPASLCQEDAASYVGISRTQFVKICKLYPDKLRAFNLLGGGDPRWSRDAIDEFLLWRKSIGVEERQHGRAG